MLWLKQSGVNVGVYVVTETIRNWTLEYMLSLKQIGVNIGVLKLWLKQLGLDIGVFVTTETVRSECWSICCDWISNFYLRIKYFSYYCMYFKFNSFLYAHHFYLSCMNACQGVFRTILVVRANAHCSAVRFKCLRDQNNYFFPSHKGLYIGSIQNSV
jgi:hypothetical protein